MALPKAVQRQAEEADRIVETMSGSKTGEAPETDPPNPDIPTPDPQPAANDTSQEPKPAPAPVSEEKWENRYHTLKGMYDAEVPRLHAQLKEMQSQIQTLIADKATAEAKAAQAPDPTKTLITEQDKEAFGSDLIDLIERATESKVSTLRDREADLLGKIRELEGKLGNVSDRQVVSDKDRFLMGLSQKVPDWEQLNVDQGFISWLSEVDPVYGLPRQAALQTAYEAFDVGRVSAIFNKYKEITAPKQAERPPKPNLQSQVAPTRSRVSTPPAASESAGKLWSETEIAQFYDEWRRGFIDNDEAARMEKEISAAIVEGRVR